MLITCPHLAWGAVSNPLSKQDGVNISSLARVNSTKSEGQDIYYRLEVYQTQTRHLSITWLTCRSSDHVFNLEWHECTKNGGADRRSVFTFRCSRAQQKQTKTDKMSKRLSQVNVLTNLPVQKFHCIFSVSWKTTPLHLQPLHFPARPHRSCGFKLIVSLLLSVTPSSVLLSPAGFLSLPKKAQCTFKWTISIFAFLPLFHPSSISSIPTSHSFGSLFLFLFSPSPIPLFLFSCQWTDSFLCRGAAD